MAKVYSEVATMNPAAAIPGWKQRRIEMLVPVALTLISSSSGWASAQGLAIEEIYVTAQKRVESVQDVPATVNPFIEDALRKYSVFDIDQIGLLTPGVYFTRLDSRQQSFTIRGLTVDPDNTAVAPITPYWNEQPIDPQELFTSLYDLERIEILRGPQGTLRGRTDPSGSILLYTARPDLATTTGYMQQAFSSNSGSNTQLAVSAPLVQEKLAIRLSMLYDDNGGQEVENLATGQGESNRQKSARVSLSWMPVEPLSVDFVHETLEATFRGPEAVEGSPGEALVNPFSPYQALVAAGVATEFPPELSLRQSHRNAIHDDNTATEFKSKRTNLALNWELLDHTLTSISGYKDTTQNDIRDLDVANFLIGGRVMGTDVDTEVFTQELRVANQDSDIWQYTLGLYYEDREVDAANLIEMTNFFNFLSPFTGFPVDSASIFLQIPLKSEVKAVFGHNKFRLTDSLDLQAGLRYQDFRRTSLADAASEINGSSVLGALFGLPNEPLVSVDQSKQNDTAWTGTLKLSWYVRDTVMIYGGYDRSFRPSGVTISGNALSSESLLFDSESSDNLELGIKSTLMNGRLRLNANVFQQEFEEYQAFAKSVRANLLRSGLAADETTIPALTYNADARVRGFESDFQLLLSPRWSLGGGYTYVDSRFKSGELGPCNASPVPTGQELSTCDVGGNRISSQPLWTANLTSEYLVPLAGTELYLRGVYAYSAESKDPFVEDETISSHGLLNLWAGVRSATDVWDLGLWVRNVMDVERKARPSSLLVVDGLGIASDFRRALMLPERTFGITASYRF